MAKGGGRFRSPMCVCVPQGRPPTAAEPLQRSNLLLNTEFLFFTTAEKGGVARAKGEKEKEKECTTKCKSRRRRDEKAPLGT